MKNLMIAALLSVLGTVSAAKAECSQDFDDVASYAHAMQRVKFCFTPTAWAERDGEGGWVAVCGTDDGEPLGTVRDMAEERCDAAVQGWIEDGVPMSAVNGPHGHDGMWEACMRLAAGGPYDTQDGAFWRTEGGL